jgi:tetratricopeptide (TPR) repeat protein
MQNPTNENTDRQPPSAGETDPASLAQFQNIIESWSEAKSTGRDQEAEGLAAEALIFAGAAAMEQPTPDQVLGQQAADCESKGDWAGAEQARRKVLGLREASGNPGLIAKAQMDLSSLLELLGRLDEAQGYARAATATARRTEISVLLSMALRNETACALKRSDVPSALAAAAQAVQAVEPGRMFDLERARSMVWRARCLLASGDRKGVEKDLAASRDVLAGIPASGIAAGTISGSASWWETRAELHAKDGDLAACAAAWRQAVERRRHVAQLPHVKGPYAQSSLAQALEGLGKSLSRAGDSAAANQASAEARAIRNQTGWPGSQIH